MENIQNNKDYQQLIELRSHLSIILQLYNEMQNKIDKIDEQIQKNITIMNSYLDKSDRYVYENTPHTLDIEEKAKKLKIKLDQMEKTRQNYLYASDKYTKQKKYQKLSDFLFGLMWIVPLVVLFAAIILPLFYEKEIFALLPSLETHKWRNYFISIIALPLITFLFFIILERRIDKKYNPSRIESNFFAEYQKISNKYNELALILSKRKLVYNTNSGKVLPQYKDKHKEYENKNKRLQSKINKMYDNFYDLIDEFRKNEYIIVESDYQYVDYLIYLFDSHRATILQDALKQLDMERRNTELINKIDQLQGQLNLSVKMICNAIEKQTIVLTESFSTIILNSTKAIIGKIDETNSKLDQINDNIQDSNAALDKINDTITKVGKNINKNQEYIASLIHKGNKISSRGYSKICEEISYLDE